jgi:CheY-like chemotaxis protein
MSEDESKPAARSLRVGVVDPSGAVTEAAERALADLGEVVRLRADEETGRLDDAGSVDALVVALEAPTAAAVAFFARCRTEYPVPPLVLLAKDIDVDLAVELLAFGADDLATLPVDPAVLCRKLERALGLRSGPVLDREEVAPLGSARSRRRGRDRRRCARARVPTWHATRARIRLGERQVVAIVVDLSVPTEGHPGGMLLRVDPASARELPFDRWQQDERIDLWLELPGDDSPIAVEGRFVPRLRKGPARFVDFAVCYGVDDERIRAYWSSIQ